MKSLPIAFLMVITLFAYLVHVITKNFYSKSVTNKVSGYYLYASLTAFVCTVFFLIISGGFKTPSMYTLILAVVFGLITMAQNLFFSLALLKGPLSYTNVIANFSSVVTAFSGFFIWNEKLTVFQIIGIALMMVSMYLSVKKSKGEKSTNVAWLILSILNAVAIASIGLLQKTYQKSDYKDELISFLTVSFAVTAVISLILALIVNKRKSDNVFKSIFISKKASLTVIGILIAAGIAVSLNNYINLYLSGVMNTAVFFPIVNGGGLLLAVLASSLLFKERLVKSQKIGLIFGIAATLCLCF